MGARGSGPGPPLTLHQTGALCAVCVAVGGGHFYFQGGRLEFLVRHTRPPRVDASRPGSDWNFIMSFGSEPRMPASVVGSPGWRGDGGCRGELEAPGSGRERQAARLGPPRGRVPSAEREAGRVQPGFTRLGHSHSPLLPSSIAIPDFLRELQFANPNL